MYSGLATWNAEEHRGERNAVCTRVFVSVCEIPRRRRELPRPSSAGRLYVEAMPFLHEGHARTSTPGQHLSCRESRRTAYGEQLSSRRHYPPGRPSSNPATEFRDTVRKINEAHLYRPNFNDFLFLVYFCERLNGLMVTTRVIV